MSEAVARCNWWEGTCTFDGFWVYVFIGLGINAVIALVVWRFSNPASLFPRALVGGRHGQHNPLGPAAPAEPWQKTGFWDSSDRDIRDHNRKKAE